MQNRIQLGEFGVLGAHFLLRSTGLILIIFSLSAGPSWPQSAPSELTSSQQNTGEQATSDGTAPEAGYKFALQEQSEVWANLLGGGHRGTSYNGLTTASLDVDLDKSLGWKKARFFVSAFDIHGHGPTRSLVGNNQIISNIEATPSLKLYDLWLEQRLFGTLYLRAGQEGAN